MIICSSVNFLIENEDKEEENLFTRELFIKNEEEENTNIYTEDGYQLITNFTTYAEIGKPEKRTTEGMNSNIYRETIEDYEEPNMNKLIRAWNAFNEVLPTFEDYYDGQSERMLLQSIFSKELQIAKKLGFLLS